MAAAVASRRAAYHPSCHYPRSTAEPGWVGSVSESGRFPASTTGDHPSETGAAAVLNRAGRRKWVVVRTGRRSARWLGAGGQAWRRGHRSAGQRRFAAATQDVLGVVLVWVAQRVLGSTRKVARAGVAVLGFLGHAARDHRVEALGDARPLRADLRDRVHQMRGDQSGRAVSAIRRGPDQAFVKHAGQCVDVGAVGDLVVGKPFGGHVFPGADRRAQLGQFFIGGRAGDAEVHQVGEVVVGDQDVRWLDVAVHDTGGVGGVQRRGDLEDDRHRAWRGQGAESLENAVEVGALDHAHLQVHLPVDFAVIVDRHDVGFLQSAGDARLALHPLAEHRILAELGGHQLDRDRPLLHGVLGLVDLAHPAAAQQPLEVVGPEHRAGPRVWCLAHR